MPQEKEEIESQLVEIEREMYSLEAQRKLLLYILDGINSEVKSNA